MLVDSLVDFKFSKVEKSALHELLDGLKHMPENLSFARNKAFELVRDNYCENKGEFLDSFKWLEKVIKTIDLVKGHSLPVRSDAYFSPGTEPVNKITSLIERAVASIKVCVFTISDNNITQALLQAYHREISVEIISDNDKANDLGSDIYHLAEQGVPVKIDRTANHMHHKFAIVDHKYLINGSFNWTRSATHYNEENIVVSEDLSLIQQFDKQFGRLWTECELV